MYQMVALLDRSPVLSQGKSSLAGHASIPWLVGLLAAAPTLVATRHAGFVADDWSFAAAAEANAWSWWTNGIDIKFRPVQAAYHGVTFNLLGASPAPHLLLLAALQLVAAALFVIVGRRFLPATAALTAGLVWAVIPTRGASRFWISAAPVTIAVIFLLLGALAVSRGRRGRWWAVLSCCAAVLTYEAGVAIGLLIVVAAFHSVSDSSVVDRCRSALPGLVPYLGVVSWNLLTSPKSPGGGIADPVRTLDGMMGLSLAPRLAPSLFVAILVTVVVGLAIGVGSVATRDTTTRLAVSGVALAAAGAAPLFVSGIPINASGPGDRVGTFAAIGVSLLIAGGLSPLAMRRPARGVAAAVVVLSVLSIAGFDDLADVQAAQRDGAAVVEAIGGLSAALQAERLVLAPTENHHGWIAFGFGSARDATRLHGFELHLRETLYELGPVEPDETVIVLEGGRLVPQ